MPTTPTVLVLGATGRFGQAACAAFAQAGWQVLAQRRPRPQAPAVAPARGRWVEADPRDHDALQRLVPAADVVVHAMNPAYTAAAWRREAPGLMATAIAHARRRGALLLFPGNVYNFGAAMPALLREDTPQRPTTAKGAVRVALEQQLAQAAGQGLRSVVLRAGDFFGGSPGTLLDMVLARRLRRGIVGLPGRLDVATPYAFLPDLAQACVRVAQQGARLDGARVLHFGGHLLTGAQWRDALAAAAQRAGWLAPGQAPAVRPLPWWAVRALAPVVPLCASLAEMRYLWSTPHALDNTALQALAGPEPHTPLDAALAESLAGLGWTARPSLQAA